jgi:hypothetical protein
MCDMNGPNQIAGPNAWGGNHRGKGGNVIKVAGSGTWVDTLKYPGDDSITNPAVAKGFTVNEGNNIWPLTKSYRSSE